MRIACLDIPALPLQILWRQEPEWRAHPVVVIDEDRPQGSVLWACERARAAGVLAGQRYAHALSLCGVLRARVVPPEQITAAIGELQIALHRMSPRVSAGFAGARSAAQPRGGSIASAGFAGARSAAQPRGGSIAPGEDGPGTFWLDGDGLAHIFGDASKWGAAIGRTIAELGYRGAVVVGFSRFATYAIARATREGIVVLRSDEQERTAARAVPLARLDIEPKLRDALARLGVTTVGQMVRLPGGGILERFGREAHRLYQLAAGERWDPLVPEAPPEAPDERVLLDDDEDDIERLVFVLRAPLDRLLDRLAAKARAVTALHVELAIKHAVGDIEVRAECIKPAAPTLDGRALLRLVHLRLSGAPPSGPVNALRVWADDVAATREQLALFATKPRRDLRAADEALARLRAELGEDAVVRAVLREGHLPEASFGWERLVHVVPAKPTPRLVQGVPVAQALVRRLFTRPQRLPPQPRQVRDDGWLLSGLEHGAVVRIHGPFIVSGGWWASREQTELHREYHFAELRRGDCLWVYYDRNRRRWFWHGSVQ